MESTGYSCKDFPFRTTWNRLLLRKDEIKPGNWPEIPLSLSFRRTSSCQTLLKALDISIAAAKEAPNLLKSLSILSDATVRRFAIDREDLKPYWKSEKRPDCWRWLASLLFNSFSEVFVNHREKTSKTVY